MIIEELYDALIEAGASEGKARSASRAIADMHGHFTNIQTEIGLLHQKLDQKISELNQKFSELNQKVSELNQKIDHKIAELRSEINGTLRLHNWMLGTILAFLVAIFFKVFSH